MKTLPGKSFVFVAVMLLLLVATESMASEGHEYRWGDFGYRVVNFILFFGILWYFTRKIITGYFKGRRANIQETFDGLDERRANAQKKLDEVESHIKNLEAERKAILDESRTQAEALKKTILDDAKRQAEQIVQQARMTAENEGRSILSQVRSTVADEIVDAAEKLLREKLGSAEHKKLITNSLSKVVLH